MPKHVSYLAGTIAIAAIFVAGMLYATKSATLAALPDASALAVLSTTAIDTAPEQAPQAFPIPEETVEEVEPNSTASKQLAAAAASPSGEQESGGTGVHRIAHPYDEPPLEFSSIDTRGRAALVNILCLSDGRTSSISGSGIIVDPRGIILTNAHVAQFQLLAESGSVSISCEVRTGAPAHDAWRARILYIPSPWIEKHASEIESASPTGTGEDDFALLYIERSANGAPRPTNFPYLPIDAREAIGFQGDPILALAYPAEFSIDSVGDQLYPTSVLGSIHELLTFATSSVDAFSLGGIAVAQGGSSGGAIVNAWGRVIGIISNTSEGETTSARDLRAITLAHIDRSISRDTGESLSTFLSRPPQESVNSFEATRAPHLEQLLLDAILR